MHYHNKEKKPVFWNQTIPTASQKQQKEGWKEDLTQSPRYARKHPRDLSGSFPKGGGRKNDKIPRDKNGVPLGGNARQEERRKANKPYWYYTNGSKDALGVAKRGAKTWAVMNSPQRPREREIVPLDERKLLKMDPQPVSIDHEDQGYRELEPVKFPEEVQPVVKAKETPTPLKEKEPTQEAAPIKKTVPAKEEIPARPQKESPAINLTLQLDLKYKPDQDEYLKFSDAAAEAAKLFKYYQKYKDTYGLEKDDFYFVVTGETILSKNQTVNKLTIKGQVQPGTGIDLMQARADKLKATLMQLGGIKSDHILAVPGTGESAIKASVKIMNESYIRQKWPGAMEKYGIK